MGPSYGQAGYKKSEHKEESSKGIHLPVSWMQTQGEVVPQSCKHTVCANMTDYTRLTNQDRPLIPSAALLRFSGTETSKVSRETQARAEHSLLFPVSFFVTQRP